MSNELNNVQQKIVEHTDGAVMVLAGAGSGKTRVLTYRIAYILNNNLAFPSQILAITFTNKAAGEIRERLALMCQNSQYIWAQTFHSFCARFLRNEIQVLEGYTKNFSIYDESDKKLVLKKILKNNDLKEDEFLSDLMHDISFYKNHNLSIEQMSERFMYKPDYPTISKLMKEYEEVMQKNNALDFDDLLIKTLCILKTNEDVRQKYQENFKYILVDEFQDTNQVQYELIKILSDKHKNVFVVGDEDQSIYSWRGASVENIQKFLKDNTNATLYKLEQNYRSTKNIIECANSVIKHNVNRIDKTLFTANESGVKVQYSAKWTDKEEAEYVVQEIYNLVHNSNYTYNDIVILMRLNALTRSFEDKLLTYNIPYKIFGGLKFYERAEIKNILAYLKLLVNPKDNESFSRIINFPKRNIGDVAVSKLLQKSQGDSLLETVLNLGEAEFSDKIFTKFKDFKILMQDFMMQKDKLSISKLAEYLIKKLNLEQVYATGKEEDENRFYNLSELVASMEQFENENEDNSLENYLQSVSLIADIDTFDQAENSVTLATVHSAKGLEFKVVFVVGLEERYFPIIRDYASEMEIEEERRLMYVAVTRCKERLYLTNANNRYLYGKTNFTIPSRFLAEMGFGKSKESDMETHHSYSYGFNNYKNGLSKSGFGESYNRPIYNQSSNIKSTLEVNSSSDISYKVGDEVLHNKFGKGTVINYQKVGDILTINFEGVGNKILSAKFAVLEKIN